MSAVHVTLLVVTAAAVAAVIELLRQRHIKDKYAVVWILVCVPMVVFAIAPGLFNGLAHALGVVNPPDLLTVLACVFLLLVCAYMSWELGRLDDRTRRLAEEVALLRHELGDRLPGQGRAGGEERRGYRQGGPELGQEGRGYRQGPSEGGGEAESARR